MYKPFFKLLILALLTVIISCTPQNFINKDNELLERDIQVINKIIVEDKKNSEKNNLSNTTRLEEKNYLESKINNEIELIFPTHDIKGITKDFINAFELSLYKKRINNISININLFSNEAELDNIIEAKARPGKIFVGPITSSHTKNLIKKCEKGILFFSFASDKKYAKNCIFLINFFPEDDLTTLFNNFSQGSKIALLYPENEYGYYINSIVDPIATASNSILINRASYKEDLSNARESIKELGKYELRKYELERQKTLLKNKNDEISKRALKKIEKFETAGEVDFTHIMLPDYGIRLLQIAPLLPFYDIDPNKVQFVGTGVWDDAAFFYEPSLQGSIFPGIPQEKRRSFIDDFYNHYNYKPNRTATIPYDIIGILEYMINNNLSLQDVFDLLNHQSTTFDGIDGKFFFKENLVSRKLDILKILEGKAILVKSF